MHSVLWRHGAAGRSGRNSTYGDANAPRPGTVTERNRRMLENPEKYDALKNKNRIAYADLTEEERKARNDYNNSLKRQKIAAAKPAAVDAAVAPAASTVTTQPVLLCGGTCELDNKYGRYNCHVSGSHRYNFGPLDSRVVCGSVRNGRFCSEACPCYFRASCLADVGKVHQLIETYTVAGTGTVLDGQEGVRVRKGKSIPIGHLFALFGGRRVTAKTYLEMCSATPDSGTDYVSADDNRYAMATIGMQKIVLPRVNGVFVQEATIFNRANHSCRYNAQVVPVMAADSRLYFAVAQATCNLFSLDPITINYGDKYAGGECDCGHVQCTKQRIGRPALLPHGAYKSI